jgi:hypothetical protein
MRRPSNGHTIPSTINETRVKRVKDDSKLESHFKSAAEIWRIGCAAVASDGALDDKSLQNFTAMARSRFHTFQLSISHAQITGNGTKVAALVRGMAAELEQAPGLTEQWQASEFSNNDFGLLVNAHIKHLLKHPLKHPLKHNDGH